MRTRVTRSFTFDAAHQLPWHLGKCRNLHGHTYRLEVTVEGPLRESGIVIDFADLDALVQPVLARYDHAYLNDFLDNPTAELVAQALWKELEGDLGAACSLAGLRLWETPDCSVELLAVRPVTPAGGPDASGGHVVVLSGGLDSAVCLTLADRERRANDGRLIAITFDYGQRHRVELDRAARLASRLDAEHLVVALDASAWGGSALTDGAIAVPVAGTGDASAIPVTYVPARNLIFLSVAMGVAEARAADAIWIGVNALDYSGYPDCRPEFVASFERTAALALKRGIEGNPVRVRTPLIGLTKAAIVRLAIETHTPIALTWSCYRGGRAPCGTCDACVLRAKGFAEAGLDDPALA